MKQLLTGVFVFFAMVLCVVLFISSDINAKDKTSQYYVGGIGPGGGRIFYENRNFVGIGWRYLEAASVDQGAEVIYNYCKKSSPLDLSDAIWAGKQNTQAIVKTCSCAKKAAKLCIAYRGGGFSDWFLPSLNELKEMYYTLHLKGLGNFKEESYWSSSEFVEYKFTMQSFSFQNGHNSIAPFRARVRAIRAFK